MRKIWIHGVRHAPPLPNLKNIYLQCCQASQQQRVQHQHHNVTPARRIRNVHSPSLHRQPLHPRAILAHRILVARKLQPFDQLLPARQLPARLPPVQRRGPSVSQAPKIQNARNHSQNRRQPHHHNNPATRAHRILVAHNRPDHLPAQTTYHRFRPHQRIVSFVTLSFYNSTAT